VVDHDSGRLVWAGKNRNQHTLGRFFDDLGAERAAALTHVSADGAEWIHDVVAARAARGAVGQPVGAAEKPPEPNGSCRAAIGQGSVPVAAGG